MVKAAILYEDGFKIKEIENPTLAEGQVMIKMVSCGVCSGDLFVYQNRETMAADYSRLGHEASGEIVAVGAGVANFAVGDMVTTFATEAYSEQFVADASEVVKLPDGVDPDLALGEAIACCVHAMNRSRVSPGHRVAVIGLGFMGQICLQLAKYMGADFICGIDPIPERQEMSKGFGADATYNPLETTGEEILAAHGEFDVVIEAAGVQSAVDLSTQLVALHGLINLVGYHQSNNGLRTVNMERWNFKAIDVVNGHVRRADEKLEAMQQGMTLMQAGHLDTKPLITFFEFDAIESAFQALDQRQPGLFKASLQMN